MSSRNYEEGGSGMKRLMNPLYPARIGGARSEIGMQTAGKGSKQFYDEGLGMYIKPVTNTIVDVEDLIYNT